MTFVWTWLRRSVAALLPLAIGLAALEAGASDLAVRTAPTSWEPQPVVDPANRFEARFGVFAHGVGSAESGTVSLNGELVSPRLFGYAGPWSFLVPRVHGGGFVNLSGRTSAAYVGLLWTIPVFDRFFAEAYVGPAIHNGSLGPTATHAGLGCPVLFNSGASIGYRFSDTWSVMATFNHLSNGREAFGVNCGTNQGPGRNQGLNHYGVRIGYSF